MSWVFTVDAPDESAAYDLARGGLTVYDPAVVSVWGRWKVQIRGAESDRHAIEGMISTWLRRQGLAETTIEALGVTATVLARPNPTH